jgi:REP element-mobilizing transposase RayT
VKNRSEILGEIVGDAHPGVPNAHPGVPRRVELSEFGFVVDKFINSINVVYDDIYVDKYVIMPNHVHLILVLANSGEAVESTGTPGCASPTKAKLAKVINAFKSLTSRAVGFSMWQRSYHDRIIRDKQEYNIICKYIDENPQKWHEDCYYEKN